VNVLNFVDVLRHTAAQKQVILSTADRNLFELLKRKLNVWGEVTGKKVIFHEFTSFTRDDGPGFSTEVLGLRRAAA
jgi:hypothetical protein